jgi:hypothetical protein
VARALLLLVVGLPRNHLNQWPLLRLYKLLSLMRLLLLLPLWFVGLLLLSFSLLLSLMWLVL